MTIPVVLTISGHDPTGGAGIQADSEAIVAVGCRATSAVTCLTVQNTANVLQVFPSPPKLLENQIRTLLDDMPVAAIKIGLIPDMAILLVISRLLRDHPDIPTVLDPVLASGGGTNLTGDLLLAGINKHLLPKVTLITPNSIEARRLSGARLLDQCGQQLLSKGCGAVLITGTHETGRKVINRLYLPGTRVITSSWPRLEGSYHGSGCTLASAVAAFIASGDRLKTAVQRALEYTWTSLTHGDRPGKGQLLPDRLFALRHHEVSDS